MGAMPGTEQTEKRQIEARDELTGTWLVGGRGDKPERIAQEVKTKQEEGEGERPSAASARFLGVETADSRHLTNPCH
jgi:hypothetical protein